MARWPKLHELHPDERGAATELPCGCVDMSQPPGLRAVLRTLIRRMGLSPTGRDRWRRVPYGWQLVLGEREVYLFGGVPHVHTPYVVRGIHLVDAPAEAAVRALRVVQASSPRPARRDPRDDPQR